MKGWGPEAEKSIVTVKARYDKCPDRISGSRFENVGAHLNEF